MVRKKSATSPEAVVAGETAAGDLVCALSDGLKALDSGYTRATARRIVLRHLIEAALILAHDKTGDANAMVRADDIEQEWINTLVRRDDGFWDIESAFDKKRCIVEDLIGLHYFKVLIHARDDRTHILELVKALNPDVCVETEGKTPVDMKKLREDYARRQELKAKDSDERTPSENLELKCLEEDFAEFTRERRGSKFTTKWQKSIGNAKARAIDAIRNAGLDQMADHLLHNIKIGIWSSYHAVPRPDWRP